jgi:NADH-ubiquinone oxidoreductase chain 5
LLITFSIIPEKFLQVIFFVYIFWGFILFIFCLLFIPSLSVIDLDRPLVISYIGLDVLDFFFLLSLIFVRVIVLVFGLFYLGKEINYFFYFLLMMIFIFRMVGFIFSKRFIILLVSWDLLGISSFFLVFFYNNWDRCSGSINTALSNRIGDFFILIGFSYFIVIRSRFFIFILVFNYFVYLIIASFTKRAQFPFRGWLPKAIRAPTPVSSLVHSRTLVTAGSLLIMKIHRVFLICDLIRIILAVSLITMIYSRLLALFEKDIKKIVALSTLSQIGICYFEISLGFTVLSSIHLIGHAFLKRCLFIQIGYVLIQSSGQQDSRAIFVRGMTPSIIYLQIVLCLSGLCGIFFSGGVLVKDLLLEYIFINNFGFFLSLIFSCIIWITFLYSYSLFFGLFTKINYFIFMKVRWNLIVTTLGLFFISSRFIYYISFNYLLIQNIFVCWEVFSWVLYSILLYVVGFYSLSLVVQKITYLIFGEYLFNYIRYSLVRMNFFDKGVGHVFGVISQGLKHYRRAFFPLMDNYLMIMIFIVVFLVI